MFFEVQIQREGGRRLAEPRVLFGQLTTYVRRFGGVRTAVFLQLSLPHSTREIPSLYNPVLVKADDRGMSFSGLDLTPDGAWVAQSWVCRFAKAEDHPDPGVRATRYGMPPA